MWGCPKLRVTIRGPKNKDYSILESMLGPLIKGNHKGNYLLLIRTLLWNLAGFGASSRNNAKEMATAQQKDTLIGCPKLQASYTPNFPFFLRFPEKFTTQKPKTLNRMGCGLQGSGRGVYQPTYTDLRGEQGVLGFYIS